MITRNYAKYSHSRHTHIYNVGDRTLKRRTEHTKIIFDNICYCKRKYQTELMYTFLFQDDRELKCEQKI